MKEKTENRLCEKFTKPSARFSLVPFTFVQDFTHYKITQIIKHFYGTFVIYITIEISFEIP